MAKKKAAKSKARKATPARRKTGGARARKATPSKAKRKPARKQARPAKRKATRSASAKVPPRSRRSTSAKPGAKAEKPRRGAAVKTRAKAGARRAKPAGGSGREETLAQTPETGRSVRGRTNPMPTKRSTGTAAGAGSTRRAPGLERARKQLREIEETVEGPPSSLDMERGPSAARSGRQKLNHAIGEHHETGPALTGGDVDADWEDAYAVGDEAPGGDNPTPDQDIVDDIGKALGVEYQDNEELKGADKIAERDKHRWELDPASSDDYKDRD